MIVQPQVFCYWGWQYKSYTLYNSVFNTLLTAMCIILYAHVEEMSVSGGISYALDTLQRGVAQVSLNDTDSWVGMWQQVTGLQDRTQAAFSQLGAFVNFAVALGKGCSQKMQLVISKLSDYL